MNLENIFVQLCALLDRKDEKSFDKAIGFKIHEMVQTSFHMEKDSLFVLDGYGQDQLYRFSLNLNYERLALTLAFFSDEFCTYTLDKYDQKTSINYSDRFQLLCDAFLDSFFSKIFAVKSPKNGVSNYYRFCSEDVDFEFWEEEFLVLDKTIELKKSLKLDLKSWKYKQDKFLANIDKIDIENEDNLADFVSFELFGSSEGGYEKEDLLSLYEFLFVQRIQMMKINLGLHEEYIEVDQSCEDANFYLEKYFEQYFNTFINVFINSEFVEKKQGLLKSLLRNLLK